MVEIRPDFSGGWQLDLAASDSPDLLMELQGASAWQRVLVKQFSVTQLITQTEEMIEVTIKTSIATRTETFVLNGQPEVKSGKRIGELTTRSFWDGVEQVTQTQMKTAKGVTAQIVARRCLEADHQTMIMQVEVNTEDGRQETSRRIFRRLG